MVKPPDRAGARRADRRTEGSVKHIQHRIDPDTITALCGHTKGVGRYGADRAWADGVLDDQPQTYTDAVDRGYDCPACLDELKRRRGMTT